MTHVVYLSISECHAFHVENFLDARKRTSDFDLENSA